MTLSELIRQAREIILLDPDAAQLPVELAYAEWCSIPELRFDSDERKTFIYEED